MDKLRGVLRAVFHPYHQEQAALDQRLGKSEVRLTAMERTMDKIAERL